MSKIGLYGGTFDPVHLGHIEVASTVIEKAGIDQIWFLPAYCSPHKEEHHSASAQQRWEMLLLALEDYDDFCPVDLELLEEKTDYTVDTVQSLIELYPEHEFHLILGEDNLEKFDTWKDSTSLLKSASPVAIKRFQGEWRIPLCYKKEQFYQFLEVPLIDISSTSIRYCLSQGLNPKGLNPKVLDYIYKYCLKHYCTT